jgi:hypothetical protein
MEAAVTVPMPARRRRTNPDNTIEGVAVPRLDLVADVMEGMGNAAAALFPHAPIAAGPRSGPAAPPEPLP